MHVSMYTYVHAHVIHVCIVKVRLLALDTNQLALAGARTQGDEQLRWFGEQLDQAAAQGADVIVLGHIAPGASHIDWDSMAAELYAMLQYLRQTRWGYALQYCGVAGAPCRAGHFNAGRECPLRPRADRRRWASSRWGRGAGSDMLRRPHELGTVALGRQVAPTALTCAVRRTPAPIKYCR